MLKAKQSPLIVTSSSLIEWAFRMEPSTLEPWENLDRTTTFECLISLRRALLTEVNEMFQTWSSVKPTDHPHQSEESFKITMALLLNKKAKPYTTTQQKVESR